MCTVGKILFLILVVLKNVVLKDGCMFDLFVHGGPGLFVFALFP